MASPRPQERWLPGTLGHTPCPCGLGVQARQASRCGTLPEGQLPGASQGRAITPSDQGSQHGYSPSHAKPGNTAHHGALSWGLAGSARAARPLLPRQWPNLQGKKKEVSYGRTGEDEGRKAGGRREDRAASLKPRITTQRVSRLIMIMGSTSGASLAAVAKETRQVAGPQPQIRGKSQGGGREDPQSPGTHH